MTTGTRGRLRVPSTPAPAPSRQPDACHGCWPGFSRAGGSGLDELLEPAVVGRTIRAPAKETRRLPDPPLTIQSREGDLTYDSGRDASPGRHGRMVPARRNRAFLGSSF